VRWPQLSRGSRAGPQVPVTSEPWTPRVSSIADADRGRCVLVARQRSLPSGLCWSACWADYVRGCPCDLAAERPRARTYSGQRRCGKPYLVVFAQVRWHVEVQAGAYCKTVGSAYVGSNPTPFSASVTYQSRQSWPSPARSWSIPPSRLAGWSENSPRSHPQQRHLMTEHVGPVGAPA